MVNWKTEELKQFVSMVRDHSVNHQVDVTDNSWKAHLPNFEIFEAKLKEVAPEWQWCAPQLLTKWKNTLQDYYNVKSNNANTGAIPGMSW